MDVGDNPVAGESEAELGEDGGGMEDAEVMAKRCPVLGTRCGGDGGVVGAGGCVSTARTTKRVGRWARQRGANSLRSESNRKMEWRRDGCGRRTITVSFFPRENQSRQRQLTDRTRCFLEPPAVIARAVQQTALRVRPSAELAYLRFDATFTVAGAE